MEPNPNGYIYKTTPTPKAQGTLQKQGQKDSKSQEIGEFAVRLCPPHDVRSYTHKVSPMWLPKQELNKDSDKRHANVGRGGESIHNHT